MKAVNAAVSPRDPGVAPIYSHLRPEKISTRHLERLATVYIRQSTPQQLIRHQESTEVQYRLKVRAEEFGWSADRILVIDDDLGKSGTTTEGRLGFQRLVTEVTLDHVGIIFGVEMSRLARSCKDWYQLLEVCALFRTLIADLDGVYDPAQYNDRLLLGLKATMSEAELHILKQRMNEGRLNKARRGELLFHVPIGYVRRPSGEVALEPDEEAREIVRLVFRKFEELGTLHSVLRFLVSHDVKLPVRALKGPNKGELEWHPPNRMTLQNILRNPMYAGAYTYGRRAIDPRRKIPGRPATGRTVVRPEDCKVFLKDRFPAYIPWEQYERNLERLQANRSVSEAVGAPKNGPSLLAGLAICGKCGCRMSVRYSGQKSKHTYVCMSRLANYGEDVCQSLAGHCLDSFVAEHVLKALEPASLELSLEVALNIEMERGELNKLWENRLERAQYETDRAARQYNRVEPENRLVARQLEQEWEERLRQQESLGEEYDRFLKTQPRLLNAQERESIRRLAIDIPGLWNSSETTPQDRKEIVRQVIDRVVIDVIGESERVGIRIEWAGGNATEHEITRPVARLEQLSYWPQLKARLAELAGKGLLAPEIAARLNAEGWRPPKRRKDFGASQVQTLILRLGLSKHRARPTSYRRLGKDEWWLSDLAKELDMPPVTLYSWIRRGWVKGHRAADQRYWILRADTSELERLQRLGRVPHGHHTRKRWIEPTIVKENS